MVGQVERQVHVVGHIQGNREVHSGGHFTFGLLAPAVEVRWWRHGA